MGRRPISMIFLKKVSNLENSDSEFSRGGNSRRKICGGTRGRPPREELVLGAWRVPGGGRGACLGAGRGGAWGGPEGDGRVWGGGANFYVEFSRLGNLEYQFCRFEEKNDRNIRFS